MVEQHYCLRWNNYRTNITAEFETLREAEHFVDVTLACDGKQLKAHKVVLSACSPYFKELLQGNPCSHPIIILRDVAYSHMRSLLEFMYQGEVNISQADLGCFLQTAEALKIRGLADERNDRSGTSGLSALKTSLSSLGAMNLGSQILERTSHAASESHSNQPMLGPSPHLLGLAYPPPTSGGLNSPVERPPEPSASYVERSKEPSDLRETMSPLSLPLNKRLRSDRRHMSSASKVNSANSPHNGCSTNSSNNVDPTAKLGIAPPDPGGNGDDYPETVPKVEPIDPPLSDTEGSGGGWMEDDGGGGESRSPGPTHSNQWNPSTPGNPDAPENASHLMQALSSESHLQGVGVSEGDHMVQADDARVDMREFRDDPHRASSSPPLPPSSLPHSCQLCGKMISCRRNLWKHMERVHFTNPAVQCSLCSKMFKNKYALKDHQRIYHGGQSEPFQVSASSSHVGPPSSLLSRILQDSRHTLVEPSEVPPVSPRMTSRHSLFARRDDQESSVPYNLAVPPLMTPPFQGPPPPPSMPPRSGPNQMEWSEDHYPMANRSLHAEGHHSVSKSE